ncbi:MAG: hypothetical protein IKR28_08390 [Selenomonadaceae bacterium]|nr:hypothetical protein [Selenomonadaceae bacterium]
MCDVDKYTVLVENKRSLIGGSAIFIVLLFLVMGGDDVETSAGEITMPIALEQQEKPRVEPSRRILGAEKANMDEKLADPFSIAHLTREEMEQAKLAAEAKQKEDRLRETQPAVRSPVPEAVLQVEDKAEEGHDNGEKGMTLQGIVRGEHGSMAILRFGNKNMIAAVGETVDGRTIKEIVSNEVRFDDGGSVGIQTP